MLVKDVIRECLCKMGEKDLLSETELSDEEQALIDRLLAAMNIAYRDAVTEYIPLYAEEEVTVSEGTILTDGLSERALYPVALTAGGRRVNIRVRGGEMLAGFSGKGVLRYAYLPEEAELDDEIADMRITASALSDGTLAQFYFTDKVFDLAEAYDESFRAALSAVRYKGRPMRLGAGRWSE